METREFYIDTVIKNEKSKCQELKEQCEQRLKTYPRGTLVVRESNGRKYCYFRYRDGKRVVTKYAGTIQKYDELSAKLVERDKLIAEIRMLASEIERIEKMEAVK